MVTDGVTVVTETSVGSLRILRNNCQLIKMKRQSIFAVATFCLLFCNTEISGQSSRDWERAQNTLRVYNSSFLLSEHEGAWLSEYKGPILDDCTILKTKGFKEASNQFRKKYPNQSIFDIRFTVEEWFDPTSELKLLKRTILIVIYHSDMKRAISGPGMATGYLLRGDGELYEVNPSIKHEAKLHETSPSPKKK